MNELNTLAVGKPYPLPVNTHEGATANFLGKIGSILQIGMPNILSSETIQIRKGIVRAGIIVEQPLILFVFEIGDLIFECSFDVRRIPEDSRYLPNINDSQERLAIEIHLIDTHTKLLQALRYLTLSPSLSIQFLSAVQQQLVHLNDANLIYQKYLHHSIDELVILATMTLCGTQQDYD